MEIIGIRAEDHLFIQPEFRRSYLSVSNHADETDAAAEAIACEGSER